MNYLSDLYDFLLYSLYDFLFLKRDKTPEKKNKIPTLPMKCYFCQDEINLNSVGSASFWRLDCMNCLALNKEIACALTFFKRDEHREMIVSEARLYFNLPNRVNTYYWKFRPSDNETVLHSITHEQGTLTVYTFNSIMNIDINNFQQKARMCLTFS